MGSKRSKKKRKKPKWDSIKYIKGLSREVVVAPGAKVHEDKRRKKTKHKNREVQEWHD